MGGYKGLKSLRMKAPRGWIFLVGGMAVVTLMLVIAALAFILPGAIKSPPKDALHLYLQFPPLSPVGQDVRLQITVWNTSDVFIQVDEIRLSRSLIDSAAVVAIVPGGLNLAEYDQEVGYPIGFLIGPQGQQVFEVILRPRRAADVIGEVRVLAEKGKIQVSSGLRLIFEEGLSESTPVPTPLPPTPVVIIVTPTSQPTPSSEPLPYPAVVKVIAKIKYSSYLREVWSGSGTVVSPDGLILTSAHLISPGQNFRPDVWIIAITEDPALPPVEQYYAEPLVVNEDLDLAVLGITKTIKQRVVLPEDLNLPYLELGDSSQLTLGDPLIILGYPGIGGGTITLTRGEVGGFTTSRKYSEPAFIKTAAAISGGASGGAVLDKDGRLVAIPAQLGYGQSEGEVVDCRVVADTNGDGNINQKDVCIPVGGFINALRPINLAKPLILEALRLRLGEQATPTPSTP